MKKQKPKEILAQYVGLKLEVDNLWEAYNRAQNRSTISVIRESDISQRPAGTHEDQFANRLAAKERLRQRIEEKEAQVDAIEQAVENIRDPMQRLVLRKKYIDVDTYPLPTWPHVSLMIYFDDDEAKLQATKRLHGRALQSFEIEYEKIKSHP